MDLEILKKKVSSYRDNGGRVRKVSDELLVEILDAWASNSVRGTGLINWENTVGWATDLEISWEGFAWS
jgi:hypothetical protein